MMGSKLEELEKVPRKKRDVQWRGRRNDVRLILLSVGNIIVRGCFSNSDRYEVNGGWKAFRRKYLDKEDKLSIGALDEALRYYQWAKEARVEARWQRMERTMKKISGVISKIACVANIDDAKDRKKVEKIRKESEKGKVDKGHKKRQMKRIDTILNRQRENKRREKEAIKRASELAGKVEKEEARRKAALERMRKSEEKMVKKLKKVESVD